MKRKRLSNEENDPQFVNQYEPFSDITVCGTAVDTRCTNLKCLNEYLKQSMRTYCFPFKFLSTCPRRDRNGNWYTMCGSPALTPSFNKIRFKIIKLQKVAHGWEAIFGVTPTFQEHSCTFQSGHKNLIGWEDSWGYVYDTGEKFHKAVDTKNRIKYGPILKPGDIISIIVNFQLANLSFEVNGKNLGVAFENLPVHAPLYPAISYICSELEFEVVVK
jgi:hypothetical protein